MCLWTRSNVNSRNQVNGGKKQCLWMWFCIRNDLWESHFVFGPARTFTSFYVWYLSSNIFAVKNWIQFREYNGSCSMWFCQRTTMSQNERSLQNVFSFLELLDECLSVFSKNDFEIAQCCSFLLADCQGVKAPFRFGFAKRKTFSLSNFLSGEDQIMLTCFQMSFLNAIKQSGQILRGIRKI